MPIVIPGWWVCYHTFQLRVDSKSFPNMAEQVQFSGHCARKIMKKKPHLLALLCAGKQFCGSHRTNQANNLRKFNFPLNMNMKMNLQIWGGSRSTARPPGRTKQITNNLLKFNMIFSLRFRFRFPVCRLRFIASLIAKFLRSKVGFLCGRGTQATKTNPNRITSTSTKNVSSRAFRSLEHFDPRGGPQKLFKINAAHLSQNVGRLGNKWGGGRGRSGGAVPGNRKQRHPELKASKHSV